MFINIVPPQGTVDGLQVQISQEIHPQFRGVATPGEDIPELQFRPLGLQFFLPALLLSMLKHLLSSLSVLFHCCCSHSQVFGKTLVHEFLISYSNTERCLLFFRQCNYKCTKENSVGDGGTSPSISNPIPSKLNYLFKQFSFLLNLFCLLNLISIHK